MARLYFALDLRDDPVLIEEYERWHKPETIWPVVLRILRGSGVRDLELYRCGNRLMQVLDVSEDDAYWAVHPANKDMAAWEELMWRFQLPLPFAAAGEKWVRMNRLFSLRDTLGIAKQSGHSDGS